MKTNKLMYAALAVAMTMGSCKKETKEQAKAQSPAKNTVQNSQNNMRTYDGISVSNGMVKFSSVDAYISAMDFQADPIPDTLKMYDAVKISDWINYARSLSFSSILNSTSDSESGLSDGISDDVMRSTLNINGMVRIGKYTFKIHPQTGLAYVLTTVDDPTAADLSSLQSMDITKDNITTIDMQSAAIAVLQKYEAAVAAGSTQSFKVWWAANKDEQDYRTTSLFCGDSGCGSQGASQHVDFNPGNEGWMDCFIKYERDGIYFSLLWAVNSVSNTRTLEIYVHPYAYKKKCGYTVGQQTYTEGEGSLSQSPHKYHYYANIQPLNKFWLDVTFRAKRTNFSDFTCEEVIKKGY